MLYKFSYFRKREESDKFIEINADNDREAVLKFFDKYGDCEFGCIKENGNFFTDEQFLKEKKIIMMGH